MTFITGDRPPLTEEEKAQIRRAPAGPRDRAPRSRRRDRPPGAATPSLDRLQLQRLQEAQADSEGPDTAPAHAPHSRHHRVIAASIAWCSASPSASVDASDGETVGVDRPRHPRADRRRARRRRGARRERLADKVIAYRDFPDDAGKMNRSLKDVGGELLAVPQFTLVADTNSGTRPSFSAAARRRMASGCSTASSRSRAERLAPRPGASAPTCRSAS